MRKTILKTTLFTISLIVGLTAGGTTAAGGRGTPTPPAPTIVKVAVEIQEKALIITGHNFGATLPVVILADQTLDVKHFSGQEIVASLPRGLTAATYGITVTTSGRNPVRSNPFSAALPDIDKKIAVSQVKN